jgi:hypothetical protein
MMPSTKAAAKTDLQAANLNPNAAQAVAGGQNVFVQLNYAERVAEPARAHRRDRGPLWRRKSEF